MARFHDTLTSLGRGEDGISVAYPETFMDDITGAYDEDMAGPTAKIGVLEADLAAANTKIEELKAHNYDLMMQVPAATSVEEETDENIEDTPEEDGDSDLDKVFRD